MITREGYSKSPGITPHGVAITFGKEMMVSNGGYKAMMKLFLETMDSPEDYWMHKMMNWPKIEFTEVYIITLNRLWGKAKFGWFERNEAFKYSPADEGIIKWPRMVIVGPFIRCPYKRELKGFQGFRYTTNLF